MKPRAAFSFFTVFMILICLLAQAKPIAASNQVQPQKPEVEAALLAQLNRSESVGYLIYFREKADLSAAYTMRWQERGNYVYNTLQQTANASQKAVRTYLDQAGVAYQAFWIQNVIAVDASSRSAFNRLLDFPEIEILRARRDPQLYEQEATQPADGFARALEANLVQIQADAVWGLGYTGAGITVASIDTGVRYTHQALVNQYRGNLGGGVFVHDYNWFDPYMFSTQPMDVHSHGSHTMGSMVGDDRSGNRIGVAPEAKWIACKGFNPAATDAGLLACGQFILAPTRTDGSQPNPDMRPQLVNNSWGDCGRSYDDWYEATIDAWLAAGIYPLFANGNASNCGYSYPPGLNTVGNPARSHHVTAVGSTGTSNGAYATHANWGPTDDLDTLNAAGYPTIKPQVVAPGVAIRSAGNGSDATYLLMNGTSMSTPHVAGVVALMWQAAPCLLGNYALTETLLMETATPIPYASGNGDEGLDDIPNHATGWGEVNALAAVQAGMNQCGDSIIQGMVRDVVSGLPLANALIAAEPLVNPDNARYGRSQADGSFHLNVNHAETYALTGTAYGYLPQTINTVAVVNAGDAIAVDFDLMPRETVLVSGSVTDDSGHGYPLYAQIIITAADFSHVIYTDPFDGSYQVSLKAGEVYAFRVAAVQGGYQSLMQSGLSFTVPSTQLDFALTIDEVTCAAAGYGFINGLFETFDGQNQPNGWVVTDDYGAEAVWRFDNPGQRANGTGGSGGFAIVDSDMAGYLWVDSGLISPSLDLSALSEVVLTFDQEFFLFFEGVVADVDVSIAGGEWQTVLNQVEGVTADHQSIDISALAAGESDVRVRFHYYNARYDMWWQVDNVRIGAPDCIKRDGAVLTGFVTDANTAIGLSGATVSSAQAGVVTAAAHDQDGYYFLFQPFNLPSQQVTFIAAAHAYNSLNQTLDLAQSSITRHDFALPAGLLGVMPPTLAYTLELGQQTTDSLQLENSGSAALNWQIYELDGKYMPLHIPQMTRPINAVKNIPSFDVAVPAQAPALQLGGEVYPLAVRLSAPAFGIDLRFDRLVTFMTDAPDVFTTIANEKTGNIYAGDFLGSDFSQLYVLDDKDSILRRMDIATGVTTQIGLAEKPTGHTWTGISGSSTGVLYAVSASGMASRLYQLDPITAQTTLLGEFINAPCMIGIALSPLNELFAVDICSDALYRIDPINVQADYVGDLGIDANHAQSIEFDDASGILYWAAFTTFAQLRVIDTESGASAALGNLPDSQLDAFAIASGGNPQDVPWLDASPDDGSLPFATQQTVQLDIDASQVQQPGAYQAALYIKENTPYSATTMPVSLTVTTPADYGWFEGTVEGLAQCNLPGSLLVAAKLEFWDASATTLLGSTLSRTDGSFKYYLPGNLDYDLHVHMAGYETTLLDDVFLPVASAASLPIQMRVLKPCVHAVPQRFDYYLNPGVIFEDAVLLANTGAAAAQVQLYESDGSLPVLANSYLIQEGFEGWAVPPTNWQLSAALPQNTWKLSPPARGYEGSHAAIIINDASGFNRDEWLLSPEVILSRGTLRFFSYGSVYWCRQQYNACDLNVYLVRGVPGDGDDLLLGRADDDWTGEWAWSASTYVLDGLLTGEPVRIGFQYIGVNGAEVGLDAIALEGVEGSDISWLWWQGGTDANPPAMQVLGVDQTLLLPMTLNTSGLPDGNLFGQALYLRRSNQPTLAIPISLFSGTYLLMLPLLLQ